MIKNLLKENEEIFNETLLYSNEKSNFQLVATLNVLIENENLLKEEKKSSKASIALK